MSLGTIQCTRNLPKPYERLTTRRGYCSTIDDFLGLRTFKIWCGGVPAEPHEVTLQQLGQTMPHREGR